MFDSIKRLLRRSEPAPSAADSAGPATPNENEDWASFAVDPHLTRGTDEAAVDVGSQEAPNDLAVPVAATPSTPAECSSTTLANAESAQGPGVVELVLFDADADVEQPGLGVALSSADPLAAAASLPDAVAQAKAPKAQTSRRRKGKAKTKASRGAPKPAAKPREPRASLRSLRDPWVLAPVNDAWREACADAAEIALERATQSASA